MLRKNEKKVLAEICDLCFTDFNSHDLLKTLEELRNSILINFLQDLGVHYGDYEETKEALPWLEEAMKKDPDFQKEIKEYFKLKN